ncbi:uncharacterized protein EAE97_000021 [Botrytis byssoidea]|uniref:Uncharacterized protein n=1 Tax=Botrytis byssoidea TaxID=139641 RepID=A0A9P5M6D5_9HELO|nr:uncharacterized protein EAE97_000021 [Botrytis byssoidea]KAF7954762.1 hypothetical protein EAE97_000021 [Botrytis byssoidea]
MTLCAEQSLRLTLRPACKLFADRPYRKGKQECFQRLPGKSSDFNSIPIDTCLSPYPRVPTPSYTPSNRDEQSGEGGAEEEGASLKPQALNRASTALPLINLSSRPISESQSLPNALRST